MPDAPDLLAVEFPLNGLDVSGPYGGQRPGTAASGVNVRCQDPFLSRQRGGSREGLAKYPAQRLPAGSTLVQHLAQLVVFGTPLLLTAFEDYTPDFVADPSTGARNPGRSVPPGGSGAQPNRNWPVVPRRRTQLVASSASAIDGATVTLTATLTSRNAGTPVAGQTVVLHTQPAGADGDGDTAVTNGSGVATFTVSESGFEGSVVYQAANAYTLAPNVSQATARGIATVAWRAPFTLAVSSPDGTDLAADGKSHPLVARLTRTATGAAVSGRIVRLTTSPAGRVGTGRQFTDPAGIARFAVSDDADEDVTYTAALAPQMAVTGAAQVTWGQVGLIQSAIDSIDFALGPLTVALAADVALNRLLVAVVATAGPTTGIRVTVAGSGAAQTYTLAGSGHEYLEFGNYNNVSVWYRIASADGAGEKSVVVTPVTNDVGISAAVLEYGGYARASVLDGANGNAVAVGFPTSWSAGSVPVAGTGELVVAGMISSDHDLTGDFTATGGYAVVASIPDGPGALNGISLFVVTKSGLAAASTPTATVTPGQKYSAAAASFKKPT